MAAATAFEQAYGPCAPVFAELRAFLGRAVRAIARPAGVPVDVPDAFHGVLATRGVD
ncbi:hypothetical protein [Micromonospora sp. CA-246542]|uniref:hypothetical protein n=1 Tax=Micromonospora sp. CA-246542 TaxID=3239959 RepID=UPI003D8E55DF